MPFDLLLMSQLGSELSICFIRGLARLQIKKFDNPLKTHDTSLLCWGSNIAYHERHQRLVWILASIMTYKADLLLWAVMLGCFFLSRCLIPIHVPFWGLTIQRWATHSFKQPLAIFSDISRRSNDIFLTFSRKYHARPTIFLHLAW